MPCTSCGYAAQDEAGISSDDGMEASSISRSDLVQSCRRSRTVQPAHWFLVGALDSFYGDDRLASLSLDELEHVSERVDFLGAGPNSRSSICRQAVARFSHWHDACHYATSNCHRRLHFFTSHELYPIYTICGRAFGGFSALTDQQIGGVILWVHGAMMSAIGILAVILKELMLTEHPKHGQKVA